MHIQRASIALLTLHLVASCGEDASTTVPPGSDGIDAGGLISDAGGGTLGAGKGSFSAVALTGGDLLVEVSEASSTLEYLFGTDDRVLLVKVGSGEDRVALEIRDDSSLGAFMLPGTYDVLGNDARGSGVQGATDLTAFFGSREFYVNSGEGSLTVVAHDELRMRGSLTARVQRTGSTNPSHQVEVQFDSQVSLPTIDPLPEGSGWIQFGMDETKRPGEATLTLEDGQYMVRIEDGDERNHLQASMPNYEGVLQPGLRGGSEVSVTGKSTSQRGQIATWTGRSGSSVIIVSREDGLITGQMNFSGDVRDASGGRSTLSAKAQFVVRSP